MTTDAKIGLLLALVFIVAITFVINGLPDFISKKSRTADVTTSYINQYNRQDEPGIVDRSTREAAAVLNKKIVSVPTSPTATSAVEVNTAANNSYQTILPAASEVVKSSVPAPQPAAVVQAPQTPVAASASAIATSPAQKTAGKIYVVADGDSLVSISQKFYGPQAGKKLANIQRIYEANRKTLKSMNDLQIGQKLVIPSLNDKDQKLVGTGMFDKVDETPKPAVAPKESKESKEAAAPKAEQKPANVSKESKSLREYVVKENDTLWKIAARQLGNGGRYAEIAEINKSINPDNLVVGTKIMLPAK